MDEAIKKAFEAFIYERGHHLVQAQLVFGLCQNMPADAKDKRVASVGLVQDARPEGPHVAISTCTIGPRCTCCPDTPLARLRFAISLISTGNLPRFDFWSLVLPVDGGLELLTYGLTEIWVLRISLDSDGEAAGWAEAHVEDSAILPAVDAFLNEFPDLKAGWLNVTSQPQPQPLQHNGKAI